MKGFAVFVVVSGLVVCLTACKKDNEEVLEPQFFPEQIAQVKNQLRASFDSLDHLMNLGGSAIVQGGMDTSSIRLILNDMYTSSTFSQDFCYITSQGILQIIEPPLYYSGQGTDISSQPHLITAFQTLQPTLSNVFMTAEQIRSAVDFHPLVDNGQLKGALASVFAPEVILGRTILPIVRNQSYEIWVMQTDGLVIYDQDSTEVGLNVITDPLYQPYPELIAAAQKIAAQVSGQTQYSFYQTGTQTVVTKKTYWDTFYLHNNQWKIVWVKPE